MHTEENDTSDVSLSLALTNHKPLKWDTNLAKVFNLAKKL